MKAVNLLPSDLRGALKGPSPAAGREPATGIGAYVVLGALAMCVAAFAAYVLSTNAVKQRQSDLAAVTARTKAVARQAAALKPYADFESMAKARVETVRGLAAARFDWEQALRDLSRALPSSVKLDSLKGDLGLSGSAGSGNGLRGAIGAPAVQMTGCVPTQKGVAKLMSRLRNVDGVTRVSLSKSDKGAEEAQSATEVSPCGAGSPPSFDIVVFFERSAAAAALAPASNDAASSSTVPVPNAISGQAPASGGKATAGKGGATGNSAAAADSKNASTNQGAGTP